MEFTCNKKNCPARLVDITSIDQAVAWAACGYEAAEKNYILTGNMLWREASTAFWDVYVMVNDGEAGLLNLMYQLNRADEIVGQATASTKQNLNTKNVALVPVPGQRLAAAGFPWWGYLVLAPLAYWILRGKKR